VVFLSLKQSKIFTLAELWLPHYKQYLHHVKVKDWSNSFAVSQLLQEPSCNFIPVWFQKWRPLWAVWNKLFCNREDTTILHTKATAFLYFQ
jgi:hypothetical protein